MKDILVILGTVLLGAFITMVIVMGNNTASFKSGTQSVGTESKTQIDAVTGVTPPSTPTTTWP